MKILHLTRHLDIGGIPRYIVDVSERLAAKGHKITVASTGGIQRAQLERAGIAHITIPLSSKFEYGINLWRSWLALLPHLRAQSFDVVHAHTRVAQVLAGLIEKFHGIPAVTTCHGFFKPNLGRRLWPCWGRKVIAVSPAVAEHLATTHNVPRETIVCIPNGIDAEKFRPPAPDSTQIALREILGIPADAMVVGCTARLSQVKGLEYLLEAVALSRKKHPDLYCLIVGEGPSRSGLEVLTGKLGLYGKVIITGVVNDIAPYLAQMDIFVLPSRMEGLGLSILEAFAAGKPVIASRVGGIVNVVRDRENGLLVSSGSAEEIADAVDLLLEDKKLAAELAKKGFQTVREEFSLDRMAEGIEAVYGSVLKTSGSTPP